MQKIENPGKGTSKVKWWSSEYNTEQSVRRSDSLIDESDFRDLSELIPRLPGVRSV